MLIKCWRNWPQEKKPAAAVEESEGDAAEPEVVVEGGEAQPDGDAPAEGEATPENPAEGDAAPVEGSPPSPTPGSPTPAAASPTPAE